MNGQYPQQRDDVLLEKIGSEEAFLYHPDSDTIHVLNFTAMTVWDQCDGSHSIAEIGNYLRAVCRFDTAADLENDVQEIVDTFAELGVLV